MLQEVHERINTEQKKEHAAQVNLLKFTKAQLLRDQNSQHEFFFTKPV